jgi:hypothetical protein
VDDGDLSSIRKFERPQINFKKKKKKKTNFLLIGGSLPAPEIIGTGDSLNPMVRRNPEATVL